MHQYVQSLKQEADGQLTYILDIIFSFCVQNREFLLLLRDHHMLHIQLEKWNTLLGVSNFFHSFSNQKALASCQMSLSLSL